MNIGTITGPTTDADLTAGAHPSLVTNEPHLWGSAADSLHTSLAEPLTDEATAAPSHDLLQGYVAAGLALIPIPRGTKGPRSKGWQLSENAWTRREHIPPNYAGNIGLAHAYCTPPTCALDLDDYGKASEWFKVRGFDVDAALAADDAVQVKSGRPNRAKLLYQLPLDEPLLQTVQRPGEGFELRCAAANGTTVQDVLPPSVHPETGQPYVWCGDWRLIPDIPPALLAIWRGFITPQQATSTPQLASSAPSETSQWDTREESANAAPQMVADLQNALTFLDSGPYSEWVAIGSALKSLGSKGRELWLRWSSTSTKFNLEDASRKWEQLHSDRTGYAAVFAKAARSGWANPASVVARPTAGIEASIALPTRAEFQFLSVEELRKPRVIDWTIKNLLARNSLVGLMGDPEAGKSFQALDWGAHVAVGKAWNGLQVFPGTVAIIAGEGHAGMSRRIAAWETHHEISLSGAPLYVSRTAAMLDDPNSCRSVGDAIQAIADSSGQSPALIIVDTLARNYSGDENSANEMSAFIRGLDALRGAWKSTVMVVHHTGLAQDARTRGRGSSALRGALDTEFILRNHLKNGRALISSKAKDWERPEEISIRLQQVELPSEWDDEDGDVQTSAVVVPIVRAKLNFRSEKQEAVFNVLGSMAAAGEPVSRAAFYEELEKRTVLLCYKRRWDVVKQLKKRGEIIEEDGTLRLATLH